MLFSSLSFLIWFFPFVILVHRLLPQRFRNLFLLLSSVFFYAWGEIKYLPLLLTLTLFNWLLGFCCGAKSRNLASFGLALSLLMNFGVLFFYKYAAWIFDALNLNLLSRANLALPLGISFFTFQSQAYLIDIWRRQARPERSLVHYGAFILLFPQFIAGPIVLYSDINQELHKRILPPAQLEQGMLLFLSGLSSKLLLANRLGLVWDTAAQASLLSAPAAWLGIIGFGFQIYFDFAGYSLMAIGIGKMLGFHFPQNFNHPYAAVSVRDFWKRWHMTLSRWFLDYVYIPLGGSRKGKPRTLVNLFIVWSLTGLWHGADLRFLLWGLWFFFFLALEHFVQAFAPQKHAVLGRVYTLLVVLLGWVLFASASLVQALDYLKWMFSFSGGHDWQFLLRSNLILFLLAALMCTAPVVKYMAAKLQHSPLLRVACGTLLLLLCIASLISESFNPFLYFRF